MPPGDQDTQDQANASESEGTEPQGGSGQQQAPEQPQTRQQGRETAPGGRLSEDRLLARYGDAQKAMNELRYMVDEREAENAQYRQQINSLKQQHSQKVNELKKQVPGEDQRVFSADEVDSLKRIGLISEEGEFTPGRVLEKLEAAQEATRNDKLRQVADAEGARFEALKGLAREDEQYGTAEREEDGETVQYGTVTYQDEEGNEQTEPLAEYGRLKPYHNSLYESTQQQEEDSGRKRRRMPSQSTTRTSKSADDPVTAFLNETNAQRAGKEVVPAGS